MGKLAPRWELGGSGCGCSRSHHAQVPGPWGGGEQKQDASVKSVGFPAQLWQSGLVLRRDNVGSTKSWGPGFYTWT